MRLRRIESTGSELATKALKSVCLWQGTKISIFGGGSKPLNDPLW